MGYLYENSNPERFQHLCQSLLTSIFPMLQCYPIGQPDGGRDGWDAESKTVLQVKFKRTDEEENSEWLIESLEKELPKILRLVERGAEKYVIATNARGTAHFENGRIDKVQKWLEEKLPIPAMCFWRDEIDRKFDKSSASLKLKYSELLSLEDGLEVVLGSILGPNNQRQQDAIRAFIATQFGLDRSVKFKQVNLSNDLLDLFIDVPVGFPQRISQRSGRNSSIDREKLMSIVASMEGIDHSFQVEPDSEGIDVYSGSPSGSSKRLKMGAAEFLLSAAAQDHVKFVVLEGAPGQGKSTLAQYVCQMHRARYLNNVVLLDRVPEMHKQTAFRVPVKVDLRDYAAFLEGNSPFSSSTPEPRTLEVFLAQLIAYNSGGVEFNAHDVLSLVKTLPVLLFLDGLDEVADVSVRDVLVNSIGDTLARWGEFDADLQVVVTSRPSVFGRALSFEKFGFFTLNLRNIDDIRIEEYADKWVVASGLEELEKRDVKKILAEKLELAHIRDLTRNPMQLTILLSLIHQVGHSLPDQRTDLYSRYIDLFFTREADKSALVRDNRQVLLGFIQHLAWFLQTQAESSGSAGSISSSGLQEMARDYLRSGGREVDIATDLFGGGLERVFVLVERIEGLYEFEVQPLREFFCAQYLYATAPVGTYRDEKLRGDRAQRFEALAASPFWLNVCRFYAGSCERGETGTLVLSLQEMINSDDIAVAIHARRVGLALLQDWVFSNSKYPQDRLIQSVFDDPGTQLLIAGNGRQIEELRLETECGRVTLRDHIFTQLKEWPVSTRAVSLCYVLRMNGGHELGEKFRELTIGKIGDERTYLLIRMFRAGAAADMQPEDLWHLITEDHPNSNDLLRRISEWLSCAPNLAVQIDDLAKEFVRGVLGGLVSDGGSHISTLGLFAGLLGRSPGLYLALRRMNSVDSSSGVDIDTGDPVQYKIKKFIESVSKQFSDLDNFTFDFRSSPELSNFIVERARDNFGETWATMSLAIRAAGIRVASEKVEGADKLFDPTVPLCARTRSARLRRGNTKWWLLQIEQAPGDLERMLWAGVVLMWSSAKNLQELSAESSEIVDSLDEEQYLALRATIASTAADFDLRADRKRLTSIDLRSFSNKTAVLVALAFRVPVSDLQYTTEQESAEPFRTFVSTQKDLDDISSLPLWKNASEAFPWAKKVNQMRSAGINSPQAVSRHLMRPGIRVEVAREVLREPGLYPNELISQALNVVQRRYRTEALTLISQEQDWAFD